MANPESSKSPAFQFYPADFVSGTVLLSTEEVGAYTLLMCHAWDKVEVPADIVQLARIARLSPARMRRAWISLESKFQRTATGYVQPRLERERQKQSEYRRIQSLKGKASGASRNRTATERQPETNRGSTGDEPEGNRNPTLQPSSSSSDFSPNAPNVALVRAGARGIGSGVMAGSLQRDHLKHAWCGRICVPDFLHGQFVSGLGSDNADSELRAFYAETLEAIPGPIGEDALKFWRARVAARWPAPGANEGARTSALRRASEEFLKS